MISDQGFCAEPGVTSCRTQRLPFVRTCWNRSPKWPASRKGRVPEQNRCEPQLQHHDLGVRSGLERLTPGFHQNFRLLRNIGGRILEVRKMMKAVSVIVLILGSGLGSAQTSESPLLDNKPSTNRDAPSDRGSISLAGAAETLTLSQSAPLTLTLKDAMELARKNEPQFLSAMNDARLAREDRLQSRAALLPSVGVRSEYLNTQGNGVLPSGRFVTNDGVHVYREWSVVHQDLSPGTLVKTAYNRANAIEAMAQAKAEVARRGLAVTVTKAYYALLLAQRKYAVAQQALDESNRILTISQNLERGGEVAHSDVVKSQLQYTTQAQALREAQLSMESSRLDLAVLLFRDFNENFQIVDDLQLTASLPALSEVRTMAERANPDLRVAMNAVRAASLDVSLARQAFLPTLTLDVDYGLEANSIALRSVVPADPAAGPVPTLGYFLTASLTLPLWDWGARKSKLHQAEFRHQQAGVELSAAQRNLVKNLYSAYHEAETARAQLDLLRQAVNLASENLRLNNLRYQAGEATVLEIVDAQTSLLQARNGLSDGEVRYRIAVGNLQTLTGNF
jgi:outer membrane protein TolC